MTELTEARKAAETLGRAFEEYKSTNDTRLDAIERRGSADVLIDEKLGRMDKSINQLQDDITGMKTAMQRPAKAMSGMVQSGGYPHR
jgi:hypothetical protein